MKVCIKRVGQRGYTQGMWLFQVAFKFQVHTMLTFPVIYRHSCFVPLYIIKETFRLGSSPPQEKSRERRTWDICSILNVTCKN